MDRTTLSPRKAADHVGCGRSSVMRALASGDLPAIRDNRNAWQIDVADLEEWAAKRPGQAPDPDPDTSRTTVPDHPQTVYTDTPETLARLAVAEARLSDVTAERDRLAALLEKALQPRPGFIERIGAAFRRDQGV